MSSRDGELREACWFPGCSNPVPRGKNRRACTAHHLLRHRWTNYLGCCKRRGASPKSLSEYMASLKLRTGSCGGRGTAHLPAPQEDFEGPDVEYDGSGRSPCRRCKHGGKDKLLRRGCSECTERDRFVYHVDFYPVRLGSEFGLTAQ